MNAAEKMAIRVDGHAALITLDKHLGDLVRQATSHRVAAEARRVLKERSNVCRLLLEAGYHPWPAPIDPTEAKVI